MVQHLVDAVLQFGRVGFERACSGFNCRFERLQIGQRVAACDGLNPAYPRSDTAFPHNFEQPNVPCTAHVCTAAELFAAANRQHAHLVAVLLTEQHHGTGFLCGFHVHLAGVRGRIGQNFRIDQRLNLADLRVRDRCVVGKVKTGFVGVDQAALLLHMRAQHFAQRLVHQVRGAVVADGSGAKRAIDLGNHGITHLERAALDAAMVTKNIGLDFLRVIDCKHGGA